MSAYLVEPEHIAEICKWAFHRGNRNKPHCVNMVKRHIITSEYNLPLESFTAAAILAQANIASIKARYSDNDGMIVPDYVITVVQMSRYVGGEQLAASDIYNMCLCLDYQSCEVDGWVETDAYWIIRAIMAEASRVMAADAQVRWSFDKDSWHDLMSKKRDEHNARYKQWDAEREENKKRMDAEISEAAQ